MTLMTWTKEPPRAEGYYWFRRHLNRSPELLRLANHWRHTHYELVVYHTLYQVDDPRPPGAFEGEWSERLQEPT